MLEHDNLEVYQDAVSYDLEEDWYDADRPLIEKLALQVGSPVLDVACGTGRIAIPLAHLGYIVTGVDITQAMLERAREKAQKQEVSIHLVQADARNFHLEELFRLIYMTGNAFQAFLTRSDQEAMLRCIHEHLHPEGLFSFGTRNPNLLNLLADREEAEIYNYTTEDGRHVIISGYQKYDPIAQIQHYTLHRRWQDSSGKNQIHPMRIALRYVFPQEMEALLYYNGFRILQQYGDWNLNPLTGESPRMIYVCQKI